MEEYYFVFERQDNEELVVKATGKTKIEAKLKAYEVYNGDIDMYCVDEEDLFLYDCPTVNEDGEEIERN